MVDDERVSEEPSKASRFPHLDAVYGRNFRIHDVCLESAPESWLGKPGPDAEGEGLASIPPTVLEELPVDCLTAFEEARAREAEWRGKWHSERVDGLRAHFLPSVDWYPK